MEIITHITDLDNNIFIKRISQTFEGAEEDLGKLERAYAEKLTEKLKEKEILPMHEEYIT